MQNNYSDPKNQNWMQQPTFNMLFKGTYCFKWLILFLSKYRSKGDNIYCFLWTWILTYCKSIKRLFWLRRLDFMCQKPHGYLWAFQFFIDLVTESHDCLIILLWVGRICGFIWKHKILGITTVTLWFHLKSLK